MTITWVLSWPEDRSVEEQEDALCCYLIYMAECWFPLTPKMAMAFALLENTLKDNGIINSPRQIYNCDESFLPLEITVLRVFIDHLEQCRF